MKTFKPLLAVAAVLVLATGVASANTVTGLETIQDTDWVYSGLGGLRSGTGTGSITISGISGTITKAYLFWHGPTNSADTSANASITFAGTGILGTNIGLANDNCWGFLNSQAYRADVTSLVTGDGAYALSGLIKSGGAININGLTLMVFFDDGNTLNDRDVVLFNGNDSNQPSVFDPTGWQATLSGIDYSGGAAAIVMSVADGQTFADEGADLNGTPLYGADQWQGTEAQDGGSGFPPNGLLWDIRSFDVTSFLSLGPNTLELISDSPVSDCLGLVTVAFDLPAGSAPNINAVPLPAAAPLAGLWLAVGAGFAAWRRRRHAGKEIR
jgi:hypothetical protein